MIPFRLRRPVLLLALTLALLMVGQILLTGFIGLCQAIVIAAGGEGLDLSVGAVATLGGILGAGLMAGSNAMTTVGALAAIVAGCGAGTLNGIGVAVLGVPPLVATLALASVINGGLIVSVSLVHPADAASSCWWRSPGRRFTECQALP